jgi:hypothetical protein
MIVPGMMIATKGTHMSPDDHDELDEAAAPLDEWKEFRDGDMEPIAIEESKYLNLKEMPEDVSVLVMDNYFPETTLWRGGEFLVARFKSIFVLNTGSTSSLPTPLQRRWNVQFAALRMRATLSQIHQGMTRRSHLRDVGPQASARH